MSGANSTPLGRMNPAIGAGKKVAPIGSSLLKPSYMSSGGPSSTASATAAAVAAAAAVSAQINHSQNPGKRESEASYDAEQEERKRRRKSRWQGDEKDKTFIPGMPTVLPSNMSKDQEEAYLLQLQIEELSRRLRSNDLGISPNPEDRLALLHPVTPVQVTQSHPAGS
ncbi:Splicing factor 1-like 1 [Homarus americanus]|uniref:Splicing factor 1-like 1 n=1 Tax=Homarus americanus TaxID=6706 RepID=A0A8J5N6Q1_HOMAM|nr:Splicing factor 1-like 1 [Homarus americanus]